jgi:hypothetical protein
MKYTTERRKREGRDLSHGGIGRLSLAVEDREPLEKCGCLS